MVRQKSYIIQELVVNRMRLEKGRGIAGYCTYGEALH